MGMRRLILGTMMALVAASPAHAERFAMSCSGTNVTEMTRDGQTTSQPPTALNNVVYVVDTDAQTVHRYIPGQNLLDKVCSAQGMVCTTSFTPASISIEGVRQEESRRAITSFAYDRKANTLETRLAVIGPNMSIGNRWSLKCVPTEIPVLK